MIHVRKIIKIPNFDICPKKITTFPEFYMIFARKMPEFYIIAKKNFFHEFYGVRALRLLRLWIKSRQLAPLLPRCSYALCITMSCRFMSFCQRGVTTSPSENESFLSIFIQKRGQKLRIYMIACPVSEVDCFTQPRPAPRGGRGTAAQSSHTSATDHN